MKITKDILKATKSEGFIFNKHNVIIDGEPKTHWDIKLSNSCIEYRMVGNIIETDNVTGIEVKILDPRNNDVTGKVRIGSLDTVVERIDTGHLRVVEDTYIFTGNRLKGTWTVQEDPNIPSGKVFTRVSA